MSKKFTDNNQGLSPAEQKTTAAFKLLSGQIKTLKQSLKKTQDGLEKTRLEKLELEKKNILLEQKQKIIFWIDLFKFISAAGMGFAANYLVVGDYKTSAVIGIPSIVIFIVSLICSSK